MPYEPTAAYPVDKPAPAVQRDPWDTVPEVAPSAKPMLNDALGYLEDRIDRIESALGEVNGVVMRAGQQLTPLLTGGEYPEASRADTPPTPTPEDRRSTIAKRVSSHGDRVDRLADVTHTIADQLRAILDTLEV
jgi:hypothetical protein